MRAFGVMAVIGAASLALAYSAPAKALNKEPAPTWAEARQEKANSALTKVRHKKAKPKAFSAEATAKSDCLTCHTRGARSFLGYLPVPQIAGLPADYIQIQLKAYAEGRRQPDVWLPRYADVHGIPEKQGKAIAQYISGLPPSPHPDGSADLVEQGDKIFHNGAPENDVTACAVCHGPEAKGDGMFPRLAGQWRQYLIAKLLHFERERGQGKLGAEDNSQIMKPVAKSLTKEQILAVTAYLSSLK